MKRFLATVCFFLLIGFASVAITAVMPHTHGAMESTEQCPLHIFAKQSQTPLIPFAVTSLFSLYLSTYVLPLVSIFAGRTILLPGSMRAPPLAA